QIQHFQKAHAFAVSSGSHALRAYPNDAGATLATSGRTLRSYAPRNPGVRWHLWGHLKMRGFMRVLAALPFVPSVSRDADGIATRANWKPTTVQLAFVELLHRNARETLVPPAQ